MNEATVVAATGGLSLVSRHGRHFCLGSNLARLEARYAIRGVIERFPNLKLATDEIVWRKNIILHGITALPVRF